MSSMVTVVNSTVLRTWNLLKVRSEIVSLPKKIGECKVIDVLTNLIVIMILQYICIYQILTVYTLNLCNVICQLCVSKMGEIKNQSKKKKKNVLQMCPISNN